ncbi:hypothetical protein EHS25_004036 [Saitozyma podzolica]|uniref:DUF6534 domain-containing protein n=1 Tax=Saitozyma podzolica TaxID=1890683 RepID=A0A427YSW7_9TREE|nr:hypothetical protein EHS25_004036 [Saitozyma podzolica]
MWRRGNQTALEIDASALLAGNKGISLGPILLRAWVDFVFLGVILHPVLSMALLVRHRPSPMGHLPLFDFGTYAQFVDYHTSEWIYIFDGLLRIPASAFFAEKAYVMLGHPKIVGAIMVLSLVGSMVGAVGIKVLTRNTLWDHTHQEGLIFFLVWMVTGLFSDLLTTACTAYALYQARSGWSSQDRILRRLALLFAETQLPPTVVAAAVLVVSSLQVRETFMGFFSFAHKVYICCALAVLNSRYTLVPREIDSSSWDSHRRAHGERYRLKHVVVHIRQETFTRVDQGGEPFVRPSLNRTLAEKRRSLVRSFAGTPPIDAKGFSQREEHRDEAEVDFDQRVIAV